jgi:drug/metabolite transporter (DMT)-like permease
MLWALFTCLAAAGQTLRNAMQRDLIAGLGVSGATAVRFLYGLPFALLFLTGMTLLTGEGVPHLAPDLFLPVTIGAVTQILATGLMLAAMRSKSFVVTIAYTKTEPVLVALFGLLFLGERLSPGAYTAIGVATFGVMLTAWPQAKAAGNNAAGLLLGLLAAVFFALSALGFRAAIHALPGGSFGIRASTILVLGLGMQAGIITLYLLARDRALLGQIISAWRPSLLAGMLGAGASQFWFLGFALTSAANVRTLALVEVIFARIISGKMFREKPTAREGAGLILIVLGVAGLLRSV